MKRGHWRRPALTGLAGMAAGAAFGGDAEFDRIVKAIESRYGTRPLHIPFMGVANFFVKVARPEGASGFKLAVFEGSEGSAVRGGSRRMARGTASWIRCPARICIRWCACIPGTMARRPTFSWTPESKSRKSTRVLIATFERNEATVIEVKRTSRSC
jgi:hypothetical protein